MITFDSQKKHHGGIGNLMFQYAFTRMTARRLGVKFYFPEWIGDKVFCLNDEDERATVIEGVHRKYVQTKSNSGFDEDALSITDGTDIYGYFQSEKYFLDRNLAREWYTFNDEVIISVREKYRHLDFSRSVSLHFRFGDKIRLQDRFVTANSTYYARALSLINHRENLLVFSDEMDRAHRIAERLSGNIIYMDGNRDYEDLYLMGLCHDNICSTSTFSWWGAWLNNHSDKVGVCLKEWHRPGYAKHRNLTYDGWIEIRTVNPVFGHYRVVHPFAKIYRALKVLHLKTQKLV